MIFERICISENSPIAIVIRQQALDFGGVLPLLTLRLLECSRFD